MAEPYRTPQMRQHLAENIDDILGLNHKDIHTYIIGHYNPLDMIIDLVSHPTYGVCVNFIQSGWTYTLKSSPNDIFF